MEKLKVNTKEELKTIIRSASNDADLKYLDVPAITDMSGKQHLFKNTINLKNEFDEAKINFNKDLKSNNIDKEIIELLILLNNDYRIATRYSCEGHIEEDDGKFYIQFIQNEYRNIIINIFDNLLNKILNHNKNNNETFYIFGLILTIGSNLTGTLPFISVKTISIYYNPSIYVDDKVFKSEEQKKIFIKLFTESAIEVLSN